ncbi:YslB family protein [Pontibacillus sp. HMF3514]|uniref:YslB family protein n=1 Tax=Pontibacillus sp. HMF3514 TaxID=2692425 RepID=UPI00131FAA9A|nr:YslB family protein [Pontibacillus sp. HMF3514]QHE53184.1 DUF2507 domain-containing protein [Pontibacillus sp. HMF3514]
MNDQISKLFDDFRDIPSSTIGHEILRTKVLPDLLGKEADSILYFIGRNLAKSYPCSSLDEIGIFFGAMGWDHLSLDKEKKNEYQFTLSGDLTAKRLTYDTDYCFRLEAGFLAEQISLITNEFAECAYTCQPRKKKIEFQVVKQ